MRLFLLLFTLSLSEIFAYEIKDALGKSFSFDKIPYAISITPSITESIYAINAQDFLLANSKFCRFPEQAKSKNKIGGFLDPDFELIVKINPDIAILPGVSDTRIKNRLESLGIKCFIMYPEGIDNISKDIRLLGKLFKKETLAENLANEIDSSLKESKKTSKKVIVMFDELAAGNLSYIGQLVQKCGAENVIKSKQVAWPLPSKEFIITSNPDIIIVEKKYDKSQEELLDFYKNSPTWKHTNAVKNNKIFTVDSDDFSIPGPRIINASKTIRKILE